MSQIGDAFDVYLDGVPEPLRVVVDGRDVRKWEAVKDESWLTCETYTKHVEAAYYAAQRAGVWADGFSEWMDRCIELRKVAGDPVGPTQPGATDEP